MGKICMVRDYRYPSIEEQNSYCINHQEFLLEQYGRKCPYCQFDYLFLLSQDLKFELPWEISFSKLYYKNIQIAMFVLSFNLLLSSGSIAITLIFLMIFYMIFLKISDGIGRVSRGSYLAIAMFPSLLFIATILSLMINPEVNQTTIIFMISTIIFLVPPFLLYCRERTRNLYNLSDTMYVKLQNKFDFEDNYISIADRIQHYLQQFSLSLLLIATELFLLFWNISSTGVL